MSAHPTEQVDRVAQAIWQVNEGGRWAETFAATESHVRDQYRAMARAALDAATPPVLKKGYDPARDCLVIEVPEGSVGERDQ